VPLLWIQPLDTALAPAGRALVCADGTRMAGPGELIYFVASREAALTLSPSFVPVDHAVVGIVDSYAPDEADEAPATPQDVVGRIVLPSDVEIVSLQPDRFVARVGAGGARARSRP